MYELLGICLALAALLGLKVCAACLSLGLWRALAPLTEGWSAGARARLLFTLSVFPPALAAGCVLAFVVPAYVVHEPRDTGEVVGPALLLLASASACGLLLALCRLVATLAATRRLAREWAGRAEPVGLAGAPAPAFRLRHTFPVVAVVGVFRPRLFVAEQVFEALTGEELEAALAHERGHLRARDNLKRALLQAAQDALLIPALGRPLNRAWRRHAEEAADEFAAQGGAPEALALASALVKISRLMPPGGAPAPAAAHLLGGDADDLARRVRRLLQLASPGSPPPRGAYASSLLTWACLLALCASTAAALSHPDSLKVTHAALELFVVNLR